MIIVACIFRGEIFILPALNCPGWLRPFQKNTKNRFTNYSNYNKATRPVTSKRPFLYFYSCGSVEPGRTRADRGGGGVGGWGGGGGGGGQGRGVGKRTAPFLRAPKN